MLSRAMRAPPSLCWRVNPGQEHSQTVEKTNTMIRGDAIHDKRGCTHHPDMLLRATLAGQELAPPTQKSRRRSRRRPFVFLGEESRGSEWYASPRGTHQ